MNCERCSGSGWIITEKNGISAAKRCVCSLKPPIERPTFEQAFQAVGKLAASGSIQFFPQDTEVWLIIAAAVANFVDGAQGLDQFFRAAVERGGKYESVDKLLQVAVEAGEHRYFEIEAQRTDQKLIEWKQERKMLPAPANAEEQKAIIAAATPVQRQTRETLVRSIDWNTLQPRTLREREQELAMKLAGRRHRTPEEHAREVERTTQGIAQHA